MKGPQVRLHADGSHAGSRSAKEGDFMSPPSRLVGGHSTVALSPWDTALDLVERLGLPSIAEQTIRGLSTGEKQRPGYLRALLLDPRVLLLDEPASALDPAATGSVEAIV
ncbi:MAG: ATP-binding cassette domain-containing protein [Nitrospira sp.]|nr:ATP-binding cassette domain-containing protein [Nitrospira sp.]